MKEYRADFVREVGMIAAIMSDNFLERLVVEQGDGRLEAYHTIDLWAFQFQNAYNGVTD